MGKESVPTVRQLDEATEVFHNEFVPRLHAWLATFEGRRFETKDEARVVIDEIQRVVRCAGRKLILGGKSVTLTVTTSERYRHVKIQLHGRKDGKKISLGANSFMPLFETEAAG